VTRILPGEFEAHAETIMCWPARESIYKGHIADAEKAHAAVANTIAAFEPLTLLVTPASVSSAQKLCSSSVEMITLDMDDAWFRDTGPIYTKDYYPSGEVEVVATDWEFNGWGGKFRPFDRDASLARRFAELRSHKLEPVPVVLEGGSITGNGAGLLVTTEQCLLNPNRNPGLTRAELESTVLGRLGAELMLWLPHGLALDFDTDGHVDNVAAFVNQGTLMLQMCSDSSEPDHVRLIENRTIAENFIDANQLQIEIVEIPVLPFMGSGADRLVVPYLNFYIGNGFVLVPVAGQRTDDAMLGIIRQVFTDREVIGLEVGEILAVGGGGIHCITQQIPA